MRGRGADGRDVVVVGGGLAGLSATAALAEAGAKVTLLEWRPYVGGRAYSYEHPAIGETIDSQHVVLGCCTNIVELCEKAGVADSIRWYDELTFLETSGRRSILRTGVLPAPMHQMVSFLQAPMLGWKDKAVIAAGLMRFLLGYPGDDCESFASWLKRTGQTDRAVRHFWQPVVVGALNDSFERCSVKYAGKVFHESFLRSAAGGRLGIPTAPLSEFFAPVATLAERMGAKVRLRCRVESLRQRDDGCWIVALSNGEEVLTEALVLATDFRETAKLLEGVGGAAEPKREYLATAPITTVHLWYDQPVVDLDHAVLLDATIEWMFAKSRIRRWPAERGSYLEVVISASFAQLKMGREEILRSALAELEVFFPAVKAARLVKSGVLKEARATFSVAPGTDQLRPEQGTESPNLYLAGDWTRTEWPSTMEGSVRSGRMAAGRLLGEPGRFLTPELPARGLMRLLAASGLTSGAP